LVVTLILALVLGVLGASIAAGIRVLTAARTANMVESGVALGFEVIEKDLANTFPFYAIAFKGDASGIVFPGIVETIDGGERRESVGHVSYVFDAEEDVLFRTAWAFPGDGMREPMRDTIIEDLAEIRLSYADMNEGDIAWQSTWSNFTNHPDVVRVELVFGRRRETREFSRTVVLPRASRKEP